MYAFICTRDKDLKQITKDLLVYLASCGVRSKVLVGQKSIFEAYSFALTDEQIRDDETVILCHDDIFIKSEPKDFLNQLSKLDDPKTGFIGVAGTTELGLNAVWWDKDVWAQGKHRGEVWHGEVHDCFRTTFGPVGQVVVLDGLFLAAKAITLRNIGLKKPDYFEGDWDFYDLHYTSKALELGLENHVVNIEVIHNSKGELVGRDSWFLNREAFIKNTNLPLTL